MKAVRIVISISLLLLCSLAQASVSDSLPTPAKDSVRTKQLYLITKLNRVEYVGEILNDDARVVLIETENLGKIYIPKSDIKSITKIEDKKSLIRGEFYDSGPFTTRYAFTTNALPLKKGMNYAMINLYGPEAHFALTDNLSIGVMSTWLASPFVVVGKYSFKTEYKNLNFSIGTMLGTTGYINNFRGFGGLHFANVTFGSVKKNLTFSAGYSYLGTGEYVVKPGSYTDYNYQNTEANKQLSPTIKGPVFSVAGITKVGPKASFVFDSMFGLYSVYSTNTNTNYTATQPIYTITRTKEEVFALYLMPGMRFQTSENNAFQISLAGISVIPTTNNVAGNRSTTFPMPMCTWFFKF